MFVTVQCHTFQHCSSWLRTVPQCGSNLSFENTNKIEEEKTERKQEIKQTEKDKKEKPGGKKKEIINNLEWKTTKLKWKMGTKNNMESTE